MLWSTTRQYQSDPFDREADLEGAIRECQAALFGPQRIYLETKKLIGSPGRTRNIPDGYLIDLTGREPALFVVEVELLGHGLQHIATQLLEFSLSFQTSPFKVIDTLRAALQKSSAHFKQCAEYASANGFENVDQLLQRLVTREQAFAALVIIDQLDDDLETILRNSLRFPVELLTFARFREPGGTAFYQFDPFLGCRCGQEVNTRNGL